MSLELQLASLLNAEVECLRRLRGVLQQEYDALVDGNIEAIEEVTAAKNQLLTRQAELTQARQNVAMQYSYDNTPEGMQQLIATCENQWALSEAFSSLTSLAQECQTANRSNGRLITQKQQQARGALDIFRQTDTETPTYSELGKTTDPQDTRLIGKA